jgi:hypothetical protein
MRKRRWFIIGWLAALLVAVLAYGIYAGDAGYVLKNAQNFCFT